MQYPIWQEPHIAQSNQISYVASSKIEYFYIYGPIESIHDYINLIHYLDTAHEGDVAHIFINTSGGCLDTTISIIHAILRSKATIITYADGQVASAGTLIFFCGPNKVVFPYANFMFHDGSYGAPDQKFNEHVRMAQAFHKLYHTLAYDFYQPYFSKDEIDEILQGKDLYLTADEILARVEAVENEPPVKPKQSRKKR